MKKTHYYPKNYVFDRTTACGRDGRKVGGLITFFFKMIKCSERCKICNKQFKKDQRVK